MNKLETIIEIVWKKNPKWGRNPHATVTIDGVTTTGRASGCGYDKASAAVVAALFKNKNNPFKNVSKLSATGMNNIEYEFKTQTGKELRHIINNSYCDCWISAVE